jgi:restriction system protein
LRDLDPCDISVPLEEIRTYLLARYNSRFGLDPRRFEEIVASVMSDFGYRVRVTSYGSDNGIDIVALDGPDDAMIGVQVKRYANKIEAEQIRSFAGALMLGGLTKGIFVTTSDYRRGAVKTAERLSRRGTPVELWNADQFYDRLRLTQSAPFSSAEEDCAPFAPFWADPSRVPIVSDDSGWIDF